MALFAFVTLLLVSTDSWTHCLYDHHDSATFFASGKAWMNGMIPYVDFSDSKGPLLWLIYGVGYLLSPRSVAGMFWITVVTYAFVFWWLAKTAYIYLGNLRWAALAATATALSIFFPVVRYETRAEDFALLFMVWALYNTCRLLHDEPGNSLRQTRHTSIVLGIGMAATLLIKYNVSVVLGVMALFVLHHAWQGRNSQGWNSKRNGGGNHWHALGWMALSFGLFLMPFAVYMLVTGCFDDFVHEYFVVNMEVVARQHAHMRHPIFMLIAHRYTVGIYLLANALSALAAAWYVGRYRFFVITVFAVTLLLTVSNAFWLYYYAICGPFLLFGIIAVLRRFIACGHPGKFLSMTQGALCIAAVFAMHLLHGASWSLRDTAEQQTFAHYVNIMSQVEKPRVIYYGMHGMAFGIPAHSLPACKYWVSQSGSTPDMNDNQLRAVKQHRPDFVFVLKDYDKRAALTALGYHPQPNDSSLPVTLYTR